MLNRPIARTFGALALAAALATTSTVAFAAVSPPDPSFHSTKSKAKKSDSLAELSPELRIIAVRKAASRPGAPKLTGQGGTSQAGASDRELDLMCDGDWFITWHEDAGGNPIPGTFNLHCADTVIPIA
jgi:hypothetical protein